MHEKCGRAGEVRRRVKPSKWAERNISFRHDKTAGLDRFDLSLTPYLRDVLDSWDFAGHVREITVVAPEQTGKTLGGWIAGLLWSMIHEPCLSLVCYPSLDIAGKINTDKLQPLMLEIPRLKDQLSMPRSKGLDRYNFSDCTSYFMGAGSRVTSHSAKIRIADEPDDYIEHEGQVTLLQDLRKRARSFNESLFVKVCSPTSVDGPIWREFLESSQGYWYLRCLGCGKLTLRSCDIHNLNWEVKEIEGVGRVAGGTERLVCPVCQHSHVEADKREMNLSGGYIHKVEDLIETKPGYQWGALASQWKSLGWGEIAKAQLEAGKRASIKRQIYLDNSIRGLPFRPRRTQGTAEQALLSHCAPLPLPSELEAVFLAADTQDNCWYWVIRGIDSKENTYLLDHGQSKTLTELDAIIKKGWEGIPCALACIDEGGHRSIEVTRYVSGARGVYGYKGTGGHKNRFNIDGKRIWGAALTYQSDLLYYIYSQGDKTGAYWFLPPEIDTEYQDQMLAMKPSGKEKDEGYDKWSNGEADDHYFDCEKMLTMLFEVAKEGLPASMWRRKEGVWIKKAVRRDRPASKGGGWMGGNSNRWKI